MQIAENISPLVQCFCNDTDRIFFKSNKHWNEGIKSFVELISKTIAAMESSDKRINITKFLLSNNDLSRDLTKSIVQWSFGWIDVIL